MKAVSLGLLALMVSWPFLFPFHTVPIGSFWAEWWAGALGLGAAVLGLLTLHGRGQSGPLALPQLLLIPAVLLFILLLQFALGRLVFPQIGLMFAVYLLWAGLLMMLGRCLADSVGIARLADALAAAIALGAIIGAAIATVRWLGISDRMPWISSMTSLISVQQNHFAHYSWLGIASVYYLRAQGHLSRRVLWCLILPICFSSMLSGSRTVVLYAVVIVFAFAWTRRQNPQGPTAMIFADIALLLPALVVMNFAGDWATPRVPAFRSWLGGLLPSVDFDHSTFVGSNTAMPFQHFIASVPGSSNRFDIWSVAWSAFLEHPWLGQGAGNYPWASFMRSNSTSINLDHAHNIVFHLLAEFGAPAVMGIVLLLAVWARRFLGQTWRLEHFWCTSVLGIGAAHSMVEYPLWYSHFLGPTALLLGATSSGKTFIVAAGRRITFYLLVAALLGGLILGNLRSDYSKIEETVGNLFGADRDREASWWISMDRLLMLHEESLLSPWALRALIILAEPNRRSAEARADLCKHAIRLTADRRSITRCAVHLAIAGHDAEAQKLVFDVLRAFPEERGATSSELAIDARAFPEIWALWEVSLQK